MELEVPGTKSNNQRANVAPCESGSGGFEGGRWMSTNARLATCASRACLVHDEVARGMGRLSIRR